MKQTNCLFFHCLVILLVGLGIFYGQPAHAIKGRGVMGLRETSEVQATTPQETNKVNQLLDAADTFFEAQDWTHARLQYESALKLAPHHPHATRRLQQIEEARLKAFSIRRESQRERAITEIEERWQTPPPPQVLSLEVADLNEKSGAMHLLRKLDTMFCEELDFSDAEVSEVIRYLGEQSQILDKDKKGINFVLKLSDEPEEEMKSEKPPSLLNSLRSTPSMPEKQAPHIKHRVSFSLRHVSLRQVLDVMSRLTGLKVKIEEFAVFIFSPEEISDSLTVETFTVDSNFFDSGLNPSSSTGASNVKQELIHKGVLFPESASAYYNEQTSKLVVRGTPEMMQYIHNLLTRERHDLPQVEIETKFIEFTEDKMKAFRSRWQLSGNEIIPAPGSLPLGGYGSVAAQTGGLRGIGTDALTLNSGLSEQTLDAQLGRGLRQPNTISLAGLVEGHSLRLLIELMQSISGSDLMSAPKITVQKGNRGTVRVVKEFIYPRTYSAPTLPGNGAGLGGASIIPSNPQDFNFDEPKDVGVLMDVEVVDVQPASRLIDLHLLNIQMLEFDGFINYGDPITTLDIHDQPTTLVEGVALQPVFSVRRAQTSVQLRDGQTLVMGGFMRDDTQKVNDKVPILGDIPLVGLLFRSKVTQSIKRNLVILTTARLVNSDGQPSHIDPWGDSSSLPSNKD